MKDWWCCDTSLLHYQINTGINKSLTSCFSLDLLCNWQRDSALVVLRGHFAPSATSQGTRSKMKTHISPRIELLHNRDLCVYVFQALIESSKWLAMIWKHILADDSKHQLSKYLKSTSDCWIVVNVFVKVWGPFQIWSNQTNCPSGAD